MRLTWRDGLTTILAVLVVAVTLGAIRGWDWPFIGSDRSAVGVLGVLGYAMCYAAAVPKTFLSMKGAYRAVASVLGATALVLVGVGIVWPNETWIVAVAVDVLALWVMAGLRRENRLRFERRPCLGAILVAGLLERNQDAAVQRTTRSGRPWHAVFGNTVWWQREYLRSDRREWYACAEVSHGIGHRDHARKGQRILQFHTNLVG